ncbi:hypothetical protein HAX54_008432 [Datura stramonium]|uniref:Uncharacterized protein n=1 Tax=Datura stramonium TaxID=4076 RepID=A0ABS8RVH0_DATST|nr:hypothetical protein [Datura stramonium]
MFAKETETLTKVLQKSFSGEGNEVMPTVEMGSPFSKLETTGFQTPSASGPTVSGGSENETAASKRRSNGGGEEMLIRGREDRRVDVKTGELLKAFLRLDACHRLVANA